jgi:putative redox protein
VSDISVEVHWDQDQRFEAMGKAQVPIAVDGRRDTAPSPMEYLLIALASCMAIDAVVMLEKMRVPLESMAVRAEGDRRSDAPRRYTAVRLVYRVVGVPDDSRKKLERAIELSRDKYCSVLHTLQSDVELSIRIETD